MDKPPVSTAAVRMELDKIAAGEVFRNAKRSVRLLSYLVTETLDGRAAYLKEYALTTDALGRGPSFDARVDPIARVEASRLRQKLELYFATEGAADAVLITLPKGAYVPRFEARGAEASTDAARPEAAPPDKVRAEEASTKEAGEAPSADAGTAKRLVGGFAQAARSGVLSNRPRLEIVAALVLGAAAFGLGSWLTAAHSRRSAQTRLEIRLGEESVLASEVGDNLALSPDGRTLVFVALLGDGSTRLYARRLDRLDAYELPGTVGARGPFFSPDGRWVGFWSQGKLEKTLIEGGGSPITLADAADLLGADWDENGEIIASLGSGSTLWRIPDGGGAPLPLVSLTGGAYPRWPQRLPGGRAVLFTAMRGAADRRIEAVSLRDGSVRTLVRGGTYGRYLANGDLVYVDRGTLFAVPFDVAHLELRGTPVPVLGSVAYSPTFGYADLAFAGNGTLVYRRGGGSGLTTIAWLDAAGRTVPVLAQPAHYQWPRLSPDGRRLAFSLLGGSDYDIWSYDLESKTKTRLTAAETDEIAPVFTPDGRSILYATADGTMFWQRSDGSRRAEKLLPSTSVPWSFAPDGQRLAYYRMDPKAGFDLWTVPIESGPMGLKAGAPVLFYGTDMFDTYPAFSPDGHWMAYGSNKSGVWEVYVRAFPDTGREVRVSSNGGRIPAWSKSADELLYETEDHRLMAVSYRIMNGVFVPEAPRVWSGVPLADTGVIANFDLAPDGRRVIAMLPAGGVDAQTGRETVTLVSDAFAEFGKVRRAGSSAPR
ncbi:MAG TPA: hypothetical protein VFY39_12575 [Gammaproteobacteria bacterium]|nr:hypothetical protein [Gammaproteobacteria bacterium]